MAYIQSPLQAHDPVQLPEDGRYSNATWSQSGHEPYYSNEDIAVLHSIVSAAQEKLDHAPHPKPLPAAVLFKAYDEVLPTFGIDPDSDHHLSALVFRIGGEQAHGSLSDKFQAILGRMGILLEFGENTTASARTSSPSLSLSPTQSVSSRSKFNHDQHTSESIASGHAEPALTDALLADKDTPAPHIDRFLGSRHNGYDEELRTAAHQVAQGNHHGFYRKDHHLGSSQPDTKNKDADEDDDKYGPSGRRAALMSALSTWRGVAAPRLQQGRNHEKNDPDANPGRSHDVGTRAGNENGPNRREEVTSMPGIGVSTDLSDSDASPGAKARKLAITPPLPNGNTMRLPLSDEGAAHLQVQEEHLLHRAVRAREIYLASKVFNRWAHRTATRLEREAVARRHMVRFRCFRGWKLAPDSKLPIVGSLRAATAVQKLQRAVAYQEEQLSSAAMAIAEAHRLKLAQRTFERWTCQIMEQASRQKCGQRLKLGAMKHWMLNAHEGTVARETAVRHSTLRSKTDSCRRWLCKTQEGMGRFAAAQHVGATRLSFAYLGEWWDQTEAKRRSRAYRSCLLMEEASIAFNHWNLRARVQAFRWRCEYLSVTRILDAWLQKSRQATESDSMARHHHEHTSRAKVWNQMRRMDRERTDLSKLQSRSRLYIRSGRLLNVFDATVEHRKIRAKGIVRQYLMMRYTQVSSKRRKRNFYAALDRWMAATAESQHQARVANDARLLNDGEQRSTALADWRRQAVEGQQLQDEAKSRYRQTWLQLWDEYSAHQGYSDDQAWEMWATQQQRHCLKTWSIATLQRSGQAHTATMAQQRHGRESRIRVIQRWKQYLNNAKRSTTELGYGSSTRSELHHRSSWRSLPARRSSMRQSHHGLEYSASTMETPTRWTGLPVPPMANNVSSRLMAPVREADVESSAASSAAGDAQAWEPRQSLPASSMFVAPMPSTTPKAPVPAHLEQKPRLPNVKPALLSRSALMRSVRLPPSPRQGTPYRRLAGSDEAASTSRGHANVTPFTQSSGAPPSRTAGLRPMGFHQTAPPLSAMPIERGAAVASLGSQATASRQLSFSRAGRSPDKLSLLAPHKVRQFTPSSDARRSSLGP